ncbi:MAG: hypothetical protein JXQ73_29745 [Phycisphaerae bacterium]|nr:hypothetical protein [Phycisphaerae bacterium]
MTETLGVIVVLSVMSHGGAATGPSTSEAIVGQGLASDWGAFPAGWFTERIAVQWENVPAVQAITDLATRFNQPMWTSEAARRRIEESRVHLTARHLTGYQALSALCRIVRLDWAMADRVVVLTTPQETPSLWRAGVRGLRRLALRQRPDWGQARVETRTASLDIVDATVSAAGAKLSEAYGLNLWVSDEVRASQALLTIEGSSVDVSEAIQKLAEQCKACVLEQEGVFWVGSRDGSDVAGGQQVALATSQAAPGAMPSESHSWVTIEGGAVTVDGFADDIEAVRRWRSRHRSNGGGNPSRKVEAH